MPSFEIQKKTKKKFKKGVAAVSHELQSAKLAYGILWTQLCLRIKRRKSRAVCVAVVGNGENCVLLSSLWSFLLEGAEKEKAAPHVLKQGIEWPTVSLCGFFNNYTTFCRTPPLGQLTACLLLPFDVILYVGNVADDPNLSLTLRQLSVLTPICGCFAASCTPTLLGYRGFDSVVSAATQASLFRYVLHDVPSMPQKPISCQLEDASGKRRPWVVRALREIRSFLRAGSATPPVELANLCSLLMAREESTLEEGNELGVDTCAALLAGCGYGSHLLLHGALSEDEGGADVISDAWNGARVALLDIQELAEQMAQDRHPELWSPATRAARRWLNMVDFSSRPHLALEVGLSDAVEQMAGRFEEGAYGHFAALECLHWARSGDLDKEGSRWTRVGETALKASSADVREMADLLLEAAEIWSSPQEEAEPEWTPVVVVDQWMDIEEEEKVTRTPAPPPEAPLVLGKPRHTFLRTLLNGVMLGIATGWLYWLWKRILNRRRF